MAQPSSSDLLRIISQLTGVDWTSWDSWKLIILYLQICKVNNSLNSSRGRVIPLNEVREQDPMWKSLQIEYSYSNMCTHPKHAQTSFRILVVSSTPVCRSCMSTFSDWNCDGLRSSFGRMHLLRWNDDIVQYCCKQQVYASLLTWQNVAL